MAWVSAGIDKTPDMRLSRHLCSILSSSGDLLFEIALDQPEALLTRSLTQRMTPISLMRY